MSEHQSATNDVEGAPAPRASRRRLPLVAAVGVAAAILGLAACGGDDDDSAGGGADADTTSVRRTTTLPPEITEPSADSSASGTDSGDTGDATSAADATSADATSADAADVTAAADDSAATARGDDTTAGAADAAAAPPASATGSTTGAPADPAATGDTTAGTAPDGSANDSGPTTTGPVCEFVENASYPLQRCDTGPAIAVLQQSLQAAGFTEIGVDGLFGDETLYAVRTFQEDEGLTVDGMVGAETWTALDPQGVGSDDNGNGVIDPNEVDLG